MPGLLQGSHRFTIVALLAAAAAGGCVLAGRQSAAPLAIALASAVGGLCLTVLALTESPRLASALILALLAVVAMSYVAVDALVGCTAVVVAGLACVAVLIFTLDLPAARHQREARSACLVQILLIVATATAMFQSRDTELADATRGFFTPPPAAPVP